MISAVEGIPIQSVISSNVAGIGYNAAEMLLYIVFHGDVIYKYYEVPEDVWTLFTTAPSKGKYVWQSIRDRYVYERIA